MRLTPDDILQAEQGLNCLGDRELILRSHAIEMIENLAVARDSFDTIDFSSNLISILGDGFPPFPRLKNLYLGCNLITKIVSGIADSLPNLETLILTSNRICTIEDLNLEELSKFHNLQVLSITNNPVMKVADIRQKLLTHIPTLKVFNFTKVTETERKNGLQRSKSVLGKRDSIGNNDFKSKKRKINENHSNTFVLGKVDDEINSSSSKKTTTTQISQPLALTNEEKQSVTKLIEKATSVEEVIRLQNAIRDGSIRSILKESSI